MVIGRTLQDAIVGTLFESLAEGVVVADDRGRLILFNAAATRIIGIGPSEGPPETWSATYGTFHADRTTPLRTRELPLVRAIRGETFDSELVFVRNEVQSQGRFIRVAGRPLRDVSGRITGGAISFRDVTEAYEQEQAIQRLNEQLGYHVAALSALNEELTGMHAEQVALNGELAAVNQELEAFAYSVSHDLRAPLRHISGFVDLLQSRLGGTLDEISARHLSIVAGGATRMTGLIDDLLRFSRTSRADMSWTPLDLDTLARETVAEIAGESGHREVEWRIGPLPAVRGDRAMLKVVLVNLLSNALKYTRPRAHARIDIRAQPGEAGQTILFVKDNGIGFDPRDADKLFGVFQRLHGEDEFEGSGIGLATVRRIVHRHGGRTWAEGVPEEGATFYLSLPLA